MGVAVGARDLTVNGQRGKGDWLRRRTYNKARTYVRPAAVPVPFSGPVSRLPFEVIDTILGRSLEFRV